ncbi:MAG TPA: hypothetical protein VHB79_33600 [Polyangiaceae bacterium]|nr:hypothetical protein [Polyangiaceae bacterium]
MTWIVAGNTNFGAAYVAADIRVTFTNGEHLDCLQKIHRICNHVLAGFSGSVKLGFGMIRALRAGTQTLPPERALDLEFVAATGLARKLRRAFLQIEASDEDRRLGCSLVLAARRPRQSNEASPGRPTVVGVLRAPNFDPVLTRGIDPLAIGSGSDVELYRRSMSVMGKIAWLGDQPMGVLSAMLCAHQLQQAVRSVPQNGVSPLFTAGTVENGNAEVLPFRSGQDRTVRYRTLLPSPKRTRNSRISVGPAACAPAISSVQLASDSRPSGIRVGGLRIPLHLSTESRRT